MWEAMRPKEGQTWKEKVTEYWLDTIENYYNNHQLMYFLTDIQNHYDLTDTKYPEIDDIVKWATNQEYNYTEEQVREWLESIDYSPESEYNHYFDDPFLLEYFFGDSAAPYKIEQIEDEDDIVVFRYYFGYGGPNIWISWYLKIDYDIIVKEKKVDDKYIEQSRTVTRLEIEIDSAEYGFAWWGNGTVIDITKYKEQEEMYENDCDNIVHQEIIIQIENGEIAIPGKVIPNGRTNNVK